MMDKEWIGFGELQIIAVMFLQPIVIICGEGNDLYITELYPDTSVKRDREAIVLRYSANHYEPYGKRVMIKAILKSVMEWKCSPLQKKTADGILSAYIDTSHPNSQSTSASGITTSV